MNTKAAKESGPKTPNWEIIATHSWLQQEAQRLGVPGAPSMTAGPLSRLDASGHAAAGQLLDRYAGNLAIDLADLHQTFAPDLSILHGDTATGGEALRGRIQEHPHRAIPSHPAGPPQLAFTTLDD